MSVSSLFDRASERRLHLVDLDGARVAVVVHPDGERDIEFLTTEDDEPAAVLSFTEAQARALARLLDEPGQIQVRNST